MSSGLNTAPSWMDSRIVWAMAWWTLGGTVSAIGLVLALHTALTGASFPADWRIVLFLVAWFTLLPMPELAWSALQARREVWVARVAPLSAVRVAERDFWMTLGLSLLVTALPLSMGAVLAPPPGGAAAAVLFANGLLGGTLGLGVIAAAAWRGQLPAAWALPGVSGLLLAPFVLMPDDNWAVWQSAQGWRAGVLLALLATPVLAVRLLWNGLQSDQSAARSETEPRIALRTRMHGWLRGFTEQFRLVDGGGIAVAMGAWYPITSQLFSRLPEAGIFTPMNSDATPAALLRIFALTMLPLCLLSTPNLHWRQLLAPGGALRTRLGMSIVLTSYGVSFGFLFLICAPVALGILLFADDGPQLWSQIPGLLWRYVPVLTIELALAVALATLLRGWAGSVVDATVSLLAASLVWGLLLVVVYAANAEQLPVFMRRDWNYLLLVGTAAALCTWAATRVWARADLGELMRSSRKPRGGADDDTGLPLWNRR